MKVLHIVGNKIEPSNGIGRLIPEMIVQQNRYSDSLECVMLCVGDDTYQSDDFEVINYKTSTSDVLGQFDFFVFHGIYFLKFVELAKKIRSLGKRYIIKPHSSLVIQAQKKSRIKKLLANIIFFRKFIKNSIAIVFSNEDEAKNSLCWNKNFVYEGNGITSLQVGDSKQRCEGKPYKFVYLSRIDFSHKGTDILLDALSILKNTKRLNDINLTFYGNGTEFEEIELVNRISKLNFPSVSFKGPIFGEDKIKMLNNNDIFILTSRYEGFPMAVLEALDAGLPCLVTEGVNMSSIIRKFQIGWECNTSANEVADLIARVSDLDVDIINAMSFSARKYVLANHNWTSLVKHSEFIYTNCARGICDK